MLFLYIIFGFIVVIIAALAVGCIIYTLTALFSYIFGFIIRHTTTFLSS